MGTTEYPKTRKAANAVSRDKKALAEALLAEIPRRKQGPQSEETEEVMTELARVSELLAEDGHEIGIDSLRTYRRTANWVAQKGDVAPLAWRPVSFSLHAEAYKAGRTLRQFDAWLAKCEKTETKPTVSALRVSLGKPAMTRKADQPTAREVVSQASPEEKSRIAAELLGDPEIAEEAMTDRNVRTAVFKAHQKQLEERETQADRKFRDVIGDDVADGLLITEELQKLEMFLIKAHGWVKGFAQTTSEELISEAPDAWKNSCLDWLNEIDGYTQASRTLLRGDDLSEGLTKLLAEEGR